MRFTRFTTCVLFVLFILLLCAAFPLAAQSNSNDASGASDAPALVTAKPTWQTAVGASVLGLPSIQGGSVAVVCNGGSVKAYTEEGKLLWTYTTPGRLAPYITRSWEGTSYVCRTNGNLIAVNRVGRELWRVSLGAQLAAPVLIGWDGRVFAVTARKVLCYTAAGQLLWSKPLESAIAVAPVPDKQGGFVMALENGELLCLSAFGKVTTRQLHAAPVALVPLTPSKAPTQGIRLASSIEETQSAGAGVGLGVLALYPDGEMEVSGESAYPPLPAPSFPTLAALPKSAISGTGQDADKVAITLINGDVLLLSLNDGAILWTAQSSIELRDLPQEDATVVMRYDERGVYMLSKVGAAGFSVEGKRRWFIRLMGASSLPALSDDGLLVSGGQDWILYAYRFEESPLRQASLYGAIPDGSYGLGVLPADASRNFNDSALTSQFKRISEAIQDGRVGEHERAFTTFLMRAAGSLRNSSREERLHPPVQVNHRVEATRFLAYLGSGELIPFLVDLFINDPETLVKAAAAEAIGRIGVDPDGYALDTFSKVILSPGFTKDPQVLTALAGAIGSLCRFSGPPLSSTGIKLLVALAADPNPSVARNRARQELASLRQP
jgi:outer membrane protein assembly factor BamB